MPRLQESSSKRKTKQHSSVYATEIADLLVRYSDLVDNWRLQEGVWKEIIKKLAQYRIATRREEKEARRTLWAQGNK